MKTTAPILAIAFCCLVARSSVARANEHPVETDGDRRPELRTRGDCVVRNVTIHSAVATPFVGDVLVQKGDVAAIGEVSPPAGTLEIDGTGFHLAPGVVDCHSHIAIDGNVNEATVSISAEVSTADVLDPDDIAIYRALAGGVTTARLLHGSANAIGGRDEVIKLKWKRRADELRFDAGPGGRPEGIKFALGENPKRSNWGARGERFPGSRMGVEAVFYRAFSRAREYALEWQRFDEAVARGEDPEPPRKDVRLGALADVLARKVLVHSHCYRADEILMLLRASEHFGFEIATLQHVLEGYKVADEIASARVGASTFGDWWGYKIEAYDAIPQNAALMEEAGVLSSLNSDSAEMMRRLYVEAAKSIRYAGIDAVSALALVTLNPARQLGIADRVGSIEVGKDADLVLLDREPLSSLARVRWTMVDGEIEFERRDAFGLEAEPPSVEPLVDEPIEPAPELAGEILAIAGATLHPIGAPDIEGGTLLVQGGRILALGRGVAIPAGARTIDATGRHVYPGLIALDSNVGLLEIGAIHATDDQGEIGGNQPDVRASASIHAESAHIAITRSNGITRAQTAPQTGGPIRGQSAVIRLDGATWEEMLTLDRDMLHVAFPRTANDAKPKDKKEGEETKELRRLFGDAREHGRLSDLAAEGKCDAPPHDPRLDALAPFARGRKRVALHADNAQTILFALRFASEEALDAVLYGAGEGWKVVDAVAESKLPVVVGPVLTLPASRYDPYDSAYANAAVLARAGVRVAIMADDPENTRNLAFHAAMASAFGLPRELALRAITYEPARVLGLERELGTLAAGKIADLVVTDRDLLDVRSRVEYLLIDGVPASTANRQTELYEKYRERLLRLRAASRASER
jgi:imidazolonepropionase-like amidohydrolase